LRRSKVDQLKHALLRAGVAGQEDVDRVHRQQVIAKEAARKKEVARKRAEEKKERARELEWERRHFPTRPVLLDLSETAALGLVSPFIGYQIDVHRAKSQEEHDRLMKDFQHKVAIICLALLKDHPHCPPDIDLKELARPAEILAKATLARLILVQTEYLGKDVLKDG
jgi:hypothetical protein